MRVVLLTHVFPRAVDDPLGAFLLHLAQACGARAQVCVVAPHAAGLQERETFGAVEVRRFRYAAEARETLAYTGVMHEQVARGMGGKLAFARFGQAYLRAALAAVRQVQPDVLHAHWWLPGGFVGALVSKGTRTPLVVTTHGTDVEQLRRAPWAQPLARWTFAQARAITCGSTYLRERLLELRVADAARVRVIPMPVSAVFVDGGRTTNLQPSTGVRFSVAESNKENLHSLNLLTVARLSRQKSIDTLLDALARLRARGLAARLRIVGDGDQRAALEAKTRALQLEPYVEFLGMCAPSELPRLYAECDAFVLPSVREGMGLVLAEALLCGAPVIATNSGGVTDIVRAGETGLLFPERDANALAEAIEKYARAPQYAAQLAANGRAAVLERFTPERVAQEFLKVYRDDSGYNAFQKGNSNGFSIQSKLE